ncbi:MAG: ATP-binding protein [Lachnospiraceae bacterium]|nr:ATP-binding protein [Lachnospiraceae bacterium]
MNINMINRKFLRKEKEAQKAKMLSRQYELLLQAWSENAMLFHDMENHLQTIYHLAGEEKSEEICQYISHISKPVKQLSGILWTGVGIVDAVLNAKKQLAMEKGYDMDINAQLPANTGISEDDLCTVLTNLLDNAVESMDREKTPVGRGVIQVSLRSIHHFLMICVSNPCSGHAQIGPRLFLTSKKDNIHHGWGLKSVRKTVHKYNGSLSLEMADGRFTATAMMFYV